MADQDEIERRFLPIDASPVEVETRADGGPPSISGVAPPWDSMSGDLGGFRERFMPGAFTEVLSKRGLDVVATWQHDEGFPLGRTTNGTLTLREGQKGLEYRATPPQTPRVAEYLTLIREKYVAGSSFAFTVAQKDESWATDERGNQIRTIHRVSGLYDVAVVTRPAYPRSTVALRRLAESLTDAERRQLEERAADTAADEARRIAERRRLAVAVGARAAEALLRIRAHG